MTEIRIFNMKTRTEYTTENKKISIRSILNDYLILDGDMVTVYTKMPREYYVKRKYYSEYRLTKDILLKGVEVAEVQSENKKSYYILLGNGHWISERKFKKNLKTLKREGK